MSLRNGQFKRMVAMSVCALLMVLAVVACGTAGNGAATPTVGESSPTATGTGHAAASATSQPTTNSTAPLAPFKVTTVDMAVNPTSIAGMSCGAHLTVTYTATFHVAPGSPGGTVQFGYTVNNGRAQSTASLNFTAGQTTKTYAFTWSGALPIDHTYPEPGGVIVTSPNQLSPALVGPTGSCSPAAFKVTSVDMTVSPTSIQGISCGTNKTITYTATFHVAAGSNGGTIQFAYTINNGRGQSMASVTFGPGVTSMTYSFTWSGALPIDHTYPEPGGVIVTSPNTINSPLLGPSGQCS